MNRFSRTSVVLGYEWKRALARKKVLLLLVLTLVFEVAPFLVLSQIPLIVIPTEITSILWLVGALAPNALLLPFLGIMIATGAMAEEYEQGSADILLSKPINRHEFLLGKFFGGFTLLMAIIGLVTALGISMSSLFFGEQQFLLHAPLVFLALVFSSFAFYALGFAFGEVFRKTAFAYLAVSTVLISAIVLGGFLLLSFTLTGDPVYLDIQKSLPAWGVRNFPVYVARLLFLADLNLGPFLFMGPQAQGTLVEAALSVVSYTLGSTAIAIVRFLKTDVTRKSM